MKKISWWRLGFLYLGPPCFPWQVRYLVGDKMQSEDATAAALVKELADSNPVVECARCHYCGVSVCSDEPHDSSCLWLRAQVLCEQRLKDHRAQVQAAGQAAEFPPGSAAGGSLTEQRNMARAKVAKCQQLGGWLRGKDGCARCDQPRNAHSGERTEEKA